MNKIHSCHKRQKVQINVSYLVFFQGRPAVDRYSVRGNGHQEAHCHRQPHEESAQVFRRLPGIYLPWGVSDGVY